MSLPLSEHVREGRSLAVGYQLQEKHIALELTKKIRADRQNLLSEFGSKSQEETTATQLSSRDLFVGNCYSYECPLLAQSRH